MARTRTANAASKRGTPKVERQEAATHVAGQEGHGLAPQGGVKKVDAARAAIAAGMDSPADAVEFIRKRFGIEMGPKHFSAIKSLLKKQGSAIKPTAKTRASMGNQK